MKESINQYEIAAGERLVDGLAIAVTDGQETSRGGAYLLGFVIEMVLKAAFFRVRGINPATPVNLSAIGGAVGKKKFGASDGHNLRLLRDALIAERLRKGLGIAPVLRTELDRRVDRAFAIWSVGLRYDGSPMPDGEVAVMFEDASWVFAQRFVLAR